MKSNPRKDMMHVILDIIHLKMIKTCQTGSIEPHKQVKTSQGYVSLLFLLSKVR